MKSHLRIFSGLISRLDVILFILRYLTHPVIILISVLLFIIGIVIEIVEVVTNHYQSRGLMLIGLSVLAALLQISLPYIKCKLSPRTIFVKNDEIKEIVKKLKLPPEYDKAGYIIERNLFREAIVRSKKIDKILQNKNISLLEKQVFFTSLNHLFKTERKTFSTVLRCKLKDALHSNPKQMFFNEKKICLASDIFQNTESLTIFKSTYFHSYLTNEIADKQIETQGRNSRIIFNGARFFPRIENDGKMILKNIEYSNMGNHIGISTIGHTLDNKIRLWRQNISSQQSVMLMAPSGSGSCDLVDGKVQLKGKNLKSIISRAMEREFTEESDWYKILKNKIIETKILGFFRWVRRAGKPEFVGISKIPANSYELSPDIYELDDTEHLKLVYDAQSITILKASINFLLLKINLKKLSVPLGVNLLCLSEAIDDNPEILADFLGIPEK